MAARALAALLSLLVAALSAFMNGAHAAPARALSPAAATPTPIRTPAVALSPSPALVPIPATPVPLAGAATPSLATSELRRLSAPDLPAEAAGRRIDGARAPQRGGAEAPVLIPLANAPSPSLPPPTPQPPKKQPGFLRRLNAATDSTSTAGRQFERAVYLGVAAATVLPVALRMEPALTATMTLPLALTGMVATFGLLTLYRAGRFIVTRQDPVRRASSSRRVAAALALGLAVGAGLSAAPTVFERPLYEKAMSIAEPGADVRAVPGDALGEAVVRELSANPVGRDTLDALRDRFGRIRLPAMYVGHTGDAIARYTPLADSLTVDVSAIRARGWTVERFLADPALQRIFAKKHAILFAHELRHAAQSRRSPLEDGVVRNVMNFESEYESYLTEHFYAFEKLKADPSAEMEGEELAALEGPVLHAELDSYLRETEAGYQKNVHIHEPYFEEQFSRLRAGWPAHRVEVHLLLARRYELAGSPKNGARYRERAAKIAAEHGLPLPAIR